MSLARQIMEKIEKKGQVKGEPEPLPLEKPVQPYQVPIVDPVKSNPSEPEIPGPLLGGPIEGDQSEGRKIPTGGEAKKAKMAPVRIYSKLFNEEIYIVADQEELEALASKGVKEVVYMAWEIPALKGKGKAHLGAVHRTKKLFPGAGLA